MVPDEREWLESWLAARLERIRVANKITVQIVRRSYDHIAQSQELLKIEVPKVWHPEPPDQHSGLLPLVDASSDQQHILWRPTRD